MRHSYLILDYNNVRFTDVMKIKRILAEDYGYSLCLIRPNPSPIDFEIADDVIDLNFCDKDFVSKATSAIQSRDLLIRGGFPFSDKAVESGTALLKSLGVLCDSLSLAKNAASKWEYRMAETQAWLGLSNTIFLPKTRLVRDLDELNQFLNSTSHGCVLKPTHEGNNRGVSFLQSKADVLRAWDEARPWFKDGLIVEEIIPFKSEYSFDGVAHLQFVTKKFTQEGTYPVETGQEVSADLDSNIASKILSTGRHVNVITGSRIGSFHNEIRLNEEFNLAAVVEPNRRPAGMSIWDLAEKVYRTSFYNLLIRSTLGLALPPELPEARGTAAIRMLRSPFNGVWMDLDRGESWFGEISDLVQTKMEKKIEFFNFRNLKNEGDLVTTHPRQNGDFVSQVAAFSEDSKTVHLALDLFESEWNKKFQARFRGAI